jgi:Mg2+-importing ATPase
VLGVASKKIDKRSGSYRAADERDLTLAGFLLFFDPPKQDVTQVVADLAKRGVQLKIITGDNDKIARHVAQAVQLPRANILTGRQLGAMRDEALWNAVDRTDIFAEVDPNQKERLILALKKRGHVVGYMGDGINDAPALAQADVGIAIGTGTDVAMAAAPVTLISGDLNGVVRAILLSRKTLGTIKQNLFWAFYYNVILIPAAALGFLNPMLAAAAMAFSSVFVVSNSLRLRAAKIEAAA